MNYRKTKEKFYIFLCYFSAVLATMALFGILGKIAFEALPSLNLEFLLTPENEAKGFGGGIANAIVGTILLSLLSTIMASPIAVGTALYMKRYAKNKHLINNFSFIIDVLSGTPSIVLGIFGLMIFVYHMRFITGGFSLISGAIALTILILPVIERSAEEAIKSVPAELEEASYALGATKWETISKITLPNAATGIVTGIVLSVGRAAEESAVVVLTAGYSQFMPEFGVSAKESMLFGIRISPLQNLVASLPITVYHSFEFPSMVSPSEGFAAAFVLIVIVMLINAITRLIVWRRRIG
ncbi:phosphate ABC transporter membrane protein 2, PhoT family [Methanolobus tindarius DSM 2278]|uniref:Phosphate transport system permease protein PstA n=1 Tax=Methanolobus tindarius DSM 2278 TaxID=1090322 RepID=W9E0W0_METTI|nr:phosphate ABC transporter permease PstA [Methanolobus tindarius]ETA69261.1 phosphate ABC transporter membrane protein 2, PhoT family [Methanolobus tindarius DSM 2278]